MLELSLSLTLPLSLSLLLTLSQPLTLSLALLLPPSLTLTLLPTLKQHPGEKPTIASVTTTPGSEGTPRLASSLGVTWGEVRRGALVRGRDRGPCPVAVSGDRRAEGRLRGP
jgi:hypothetical protein